MQQIHRRTPMPKCDSEVFLCTPREPREGCICRSFRLHLWFFWDLSPYLLHGFYFFYQFLNEKSQLQKAVARGCSVKKVFVKILQNSYENAIPRASFLIKVASSRTPFYKEHLQWPILDLFRMNVCKETASVYVGNFCFNSNWIKWMKLINIEDFTDSLQLTNYLK